MKENVVASFIRDTYKTTSIIPYVITAQVVAFVLLHILELLTFAESTSVDLFSLLFAKTVLPIHLAEFTTQPWSIVTHPFIYDSLWNLLFDCLWLYWIGNMFLTYLNTRQFNTVFLGGLALGAVVFLVFGWMPFFNSTLSWHTSSFGLAAVISALTLLVPNAELRLFLIGNVKFKWIAAFYLGIKFAIYISSNTAAALAYIIVVAGGVFFMYQLQKGKDWSKIFDKKRRKLKPITGNYQTNHRNLDKQYPDQHQIDQILDKISLNGYESLTSREKELLFRASKKND